MSSADPLREAHGTAGDKAPLWPLFIVCRLAVIKGCRGYRKGPRGHKGLSLYERTIPIYRLVYII